MEYGSWYIFSARYSARILQHTDRATRPRSRSYSDSKAGATGIGGLNPDGRAVAGRACRGLRHANTNRHLVRGASQRSRPFQTTRTGVSEGAQKKQLPLPYDRAMPQFLCIGRVVVLYYSILKNKFVQKSRKIAPGTMLKTLALRAKGTL